VRARPLHVLGATTLDEHPGEQPTHVRAIDPQTELLRGRERRREMQVGLLEPPGRRGRDPGASFAAGSSPRRR
jgi:hypothetical protein